MSSKDWWLVSEALAPGSMPDDADTRGFWPAGEAHVASGALEGAGDVDGCDGDICGWWPCECQAEAAGS